MYSFDQFQLHMTNIRRYAYLQGQNTRLAWLAGKYAEKNFTEALEREFVSDIDSHLEELAFTMENADFMAVMNYWMELSKKYWDADRRRAFVNKVNSLQQTFRLLDDSVGVQEAGKPRSFHLKIGCQDPCGGSNIPENGSVVTFYRFWCTACEHSWDIDTGWPSSRVGETIVINGQRYSIKDAFQIYSCPFCRVAYSGFFFPLSHTPLKRRLREVKEAIQSVKRINAHGESRQLEFIKLIFPPSPSEPQEYFVNCLTCGKNTIVDLKEAKSLKTVGFDMHSTNQGVYDICCCWYCGVRFTGMVRTTNKDHVKNGIWQYDINIKKALGMSTSDYGWFASAKPLGAVPIS